MTATAPFLRLPTELLHGIVEYIEEPEDVAALVGSCKHCMLALGKDFVHVRSAKASAMAQGLPGSTILMDLPPTTLERAIERTLDRKILEWILDLHIANNPHCLEAPVYWYDPSLLVTAIRLQNKVAVQLLVDRGIKFQKSTATAEDARYFDWRNCPLKEALRSTNDIAHILLQADHYVEDYHLYNVHVKDDPELVSLLLSLLLEQVPELERESERESYQKKARKYHLLECAIGCGFGKDTKALELLVNSRHIDIGIAREPEINALFERVIRKGNDEDTKILEFLINRGLYIGSNTGKHYDGQYVSPVPGCDPIKFAIQNGYPQSAIFLLRHQVLQGMHTPKSMRNLIQRVFEVHGVDQLRKPEEYWDMPPYAKFIIAFHAEFTTYLSDVQTHEEADVEQKSREECDYLMAKVLQYSIHSNKLMTSMLANGCRILPAFVFDEIEFWRKAEHCMVCNYQNPDWKLCKRCKKCKGIGKAWGNGDSSHRKAMSHLDLLLSWAGSDLINSKSNVNLIRKRVKEEVEMAPLHYAWAGSSSKRKVKLTSGRVNEVVEMTPLDYALVNCIWPVVFCLVRHGADLTSLDPRAEQSIRQMYNDNARCWARTGNVPIEDARAGRFVPERQMFGQDMSEGSQATQALALVMLTIGLPSEDQVREAPSMAKQAPTSAKMAKISSRNWRAAVNGSWKTRRFWE